MLILQACSTYPVAEFREETGVVCVQSEEQGKQNQQTCQSVRSFPDVYKWHRVKPYRSLPDIPDSL